MNAGNANQGSPSHTGSPTTGSVQVKRVYAPVEPSDGERVLVDRLWPRGVSKVRLAGVPWLKTVAPSTQLREWYGHDPAKFSEFAKRYRAELESDSLAGQTLAQLRQLAAEHPMLTLLTATKEPEISEAEVLRQVLTSR